MTSNHILLYRIAELMLEHEKHVLPVDLLFDDEQICDFVKSIQIDSPYQQMLLEGVLTESVKDEKLNVSFTVEGYFHYVLGEVIYKLNKGKGLESIKYILEENKLNGVKEGVEQCLILDVKENDLERLIWLIDESNDSLDIAIYPIANACILLSVEMVLEKLLSFPSRNDLVILEKLTTFFDLKLKDHISDEIKKTLKKYHAVEDLLFNILKSGDKIEVNSTFKIIEKLNLKLNVNYVNDLIDIYEQHVFNVLIEAFSNLQKALDWVSFIPDLNNFDKSHELYTKIQIEAEKRKDQEVLVVVLEQLGESEYKRSGRDGYLAAIDTLTKALEIREKEKFPQKEKLKKIYKLLGSAYLSLGLQVIKSIEYFEKAKTIISADSSENLELAEINFYLGIVYYWRGLRGIGRWGHADKSLLKNLKESPFEIAKKRYAEVFDIYSKKYGKIHPKTLEIYHYIQETSYGVGNYKNSIPWLKKYVEILPFKDREHTDNYYLYCLIVALEEYAKQISIDETQIALECIDEAISYAKNYDEGNQINKRLLDCRKEIELKEIQHKIVSLVEELPNLEIDNIFNGFWSKWNYPDELKEYQTNNWLSDTKVVWFFNNEKKQLAFWDLSNDSISFFKPADWPVDFARLVFDKVNKIFYAWSSIRSNVYQLIDPNTLWTQLSSGIHDVHACGASFGFDPENNRLYEFGGYGYLTYKNWLWVYDIAERKWIQERENKPGIGPYPRNGQLLPIANGEKAILISGIGNDTGIQREHKPRFGLASATDIGYFTWLRDAYELDLKSMEWQIVLSPNHESLRHEGAFGCIDKYNLVVNWGGIIPSPVFGQEGITQDKLSCWVLDNKEGFKHLKFEGDIPPLTGGYFIQITNEEKLLFIHQEGTWVLTINKKNTNQ